MKQIIEKFEAIFCRYRYVFLIYLVIGFAVFLQLFLSGGVILGGDWGLPTTAPQTENSFYSSLFTWTHAGNPFGTRQVSPVSIIFNSLLAGLNIIGIGSALVAKIFLALLFAFGASNMFTYLRSKSIKKHIAFIGGLLFSTTPVFFNYSLMGWIFVLLAMALVPLFVIYFERYLKGGNFKDSVISVIIFSLAVLQSQSLIWYPIIMLVLIISNAENFAEMKRWLGRFIIVMIEFVAVNCYWLVGLLVLPDKSLFDANIVQSTISLGTSVRLSSENILRLWGSLFNYQFELSFPAILWPASFIIPLLAALAAFFYKKYRKVIIFLSLLYLVPFVFFMTDRQFLASIPFAALIRDVARFAVISSFGVVALISITLNEFGLKKKAQKWGFAICLLLLFLNASPFWLGRLFHSNGSDSDFKFRTYQWSPEYLELENKLSKESSDQIALFLPFGGIVSSTSDLKFNGAYREMQDISAGFSNVPGVIASSDKSQGVSSYMIGQIQGAIKDGDFDSLDNIIKQANISFVVLRRDLDMSLEGRSKIEAYLKQEIVSGRASEYLDSGNIVAIKFSVKKGIITPVSSVFSAPDVISKVIETQYPNSADDLRDVATDNTFNKITPFFGVMPVDSVVSFDDQNDYLGLENKKQTILSFVNSQKIERILIEKKLLERQWDIENINKISGTKYLTYSSEDSLAGDLYFAKSNDINIKFSLNNQDISLPGDNTGEYTIVRNIKFKQGINAIESKLEPVAFTAGENSADDGAVKLSYKKINPTKYEVTISNAPKDFSFNFKESYNDYWAMYHQENGRWYKINPNELAPGEHLVANGYSNLFTVKDNQQSSLKLIIEFWPQRLFYLLSALSILSIAIFAIIIIKNERKK